MISYVKGNVLDSGADVIAHGVNCSGGFASGVAGQIAKRWPTVQHRYRKEFHTNGWHLGKVQSVTMIGQNSPCSFFVFNCGTQQFYGPMAKHGVVYVDYPAIEKCMRQVYEFCEDNDLTCAIPKIGAGLAGGDWNVIEKIINEIFHDREILVYTLP